MSQPEAEDVTERDVVEYMGKVADKLLATLVQAGASLDDEQLRARMVEVLTGDEGARELMGASFNAGFELGQDSQGDARWQDVDIPGERKARWREQHLCNTCSLAPVCVTARAMLPEQLQVLRKCLAFTPKSA